ncbi:MAG: hypothetical protein VW270_22580, partial [Candidatus Poseidoniales archaeon]
MVIELAARCETQPAVAERTVTLSMPEGRHARIEFRSLVDPDATVVASFVKEPVWQIEMKSTTEVDPTAT